MIDQSDFKKAFQPAAAELVESYSLGAGGDDFTAFSHRLKRATELLEDLERLANRLAQTGDTQFASAADQQTFETAAQHLMMEQVRLFLNRE